MNIEVTLTHQDIVELIKKKIQSAVNLAPAPQNAQFGEYQFTVAFEHAKDVDTPMHARETTPLYGEISATVELWVP